MTDPAMNDSALVSEAVDLRLATRGKRFVASLLDALIILAIIFPVEYATGFWSTFHIAIRNARVAHIPYPYELRLTNLAYSLAIFVILQFYPLMANGQTWGKRLLHIKIVDMQGNKPSMFHLLGLREVTKWIISAIPLIASPAILVDVLLIFRSDRRCGHDWIAGTRVVEADRIE